MSQHPTTANRYYIRDEFGEVLMEVDDYDVALRCKARYEVEDGKRVRLIDRRDEESSDDRERRSKGRT